MSDYIKREDAQKITAEWLSGYITDDERNVIEHIDVDLGELPAADVVEVVRCKDCKHRPIDTQEEGNGFDYEFPEEYGCPGYCDDGYYSNRFNDDFYCAWGERADE